MGNCNYITVLTSTVLPDHSTEISAMKPERNENKKSVITFDSRMDIEKTRKI